MASNTDICNMALSHIGVGREISNLDTDSSQEAQSCRRFYTQALQATLRDFEWPFATNYITLALVTNNPTTEWLFAYQYPSDCLHFRRVLSCLTAQYGNPYFSGNGLDTRQSRVPYIIVNAATGAQIYCNQDLAQAEYKAEVDNTAIYPPDFVIALSFRIAMYIAPRLTGGDPYKMGDRAAKFYDMEISRAKATAANEEQIQQDPESEFVRSRN